MESLTRQNLILSSKQPKFFTIIHNWCHSETSFLTQTIHCRNDRLLLINSFHIDIIRSGFKSTVVLFPLLGVTWLFGILALDRNTIAFQYLFALCNSLQGFFIFVFHCLFNSEVRKCTIYLLSFTHGATYKRKHTTKADGVQWEEWKAVCSEKNPKKARYTVLIYYAFRLSGEDLSRAFNFSSNSGEMDAYNFLSTEDQNSYFNLYTYVYLNSYLRR